jgi:tetratricopeptide (TPR) repeat protein
VLQICSHHAEAHNNLASLLEDEGNYPQAIYHYRQAIQAKPNLYGFKLTIIPFSYSLHFSHPPFS